MTAEIDKKNTNTLRYYKASQKIFMNSSSKIRASNKQQYKITQHDIIQQVQERAANIEQHNLVLETSCYCAICINKKNAKQKEKTNYLATVSSSYLNFFRLLQHLTIIQPDKSSQLLGQFLIPTIFFKRTQKHTKTHKLQQTNNQSHSHQKQHSSYIMFKSNSKTKHIQPPILIQSLQQVSKILQNQQQQIRFHKNQQKQKQSNLINNIIKITQLDHLQHNKYIHRNYFNQKIPSYILPSVKTNHYKSRVQKFIIHKQDSLIAIANQHKMMSTQPLCIFRYLDVSGESGKQLGKYQIFTIQTLEIYRRNMEHYMDIREKNKNLSLIYIQSYTKTKPQPLKSLQNSVGEDGQVLVVHYSEYDRIQIDKQLKFDPIYAISKLQIQLKLGRIGKISPSYMDSIELEEMISAKLMQKYPISNKKVQLNSGYKTYKIVHILQLLCRIKVQKLKLKWIVNDNQQIVLQQCLIYQIDKANSLNPPNSKKDPYILSIIDHGTDILFKENQKMLGIQINADLDSVQKDIQKMVCYRREERNKIKCKTQIQPLMSIQDRSLDKQQEKQQSKKPIKKVQAIQAIQSINKRKMKNLFGHYLYKSLPLNKKFQTRAKINTEIFQQQSIDYSRIKFQKLKHIQNSNITKTSNQILSCLKNPMLKKSYKLRPFKTQQFLTNK